METRSHKTKIVCTIGPSSGSRAVIGRLIKAGMDVARLNLSHGTVSEHIGTLGLIRAVAKGLNRTVGIMIDLPGPKIRVGTIRDAPLLLKKHDVVTLVQGTVSDDRRVIPVEMKGFAGLVSRNGVVYLNDGFIQLKVLGIDGGRVSCRVVIGGALLSHKGLNLPGTRPDTSAVTGRDLRIIDTFLDHGADIFSISFVQSRDDVAKVRERVRERGHDPLIVAKIERREAVGHIDSIMDAADGILIARGDLGVEIPIERVPVVQKMLIRRANDRNKIVITATQMLLSMTEHIRPTRAEVTDVANAILDGTDAVMLSEETAMGDYPVEAVRMMGRIASTTEARRGEFGCLSGTGALKTRGTRKGGPIEYGLALDVEDIIRTMRIRLVTAVNTRYRAIHGISRLKPGCWIVTTAADRKDMHLLNLTYGVRPLPVPKGTHDPGSVISRYVRTNRLVRPGDRILRIEESLDKRAGRINSLHIITVQG